MTNGGVKHLQPLCGSDAGGRNLYPRPRHTTMTIAWSRLHLHQLRLPLRHNVQHLVTDLALSADDNHLPDSTLCLGSLDVTDVTIVNRLKHHRHQYINLNWTPIYTMDPNLTQKLRSS